MFHLEASSEQLLEILRATAKHDAVNMHEPVTEADCKIRESRIVEVIIPQFG
jgi:hypothetical protein